MTHLSAIEVLAHEITLVLSAIVLVFWVFYTIMLYHQLKGGTVRKDWWLSMIFYLGIGLLVLGNLLLSLSHLYETQAGQNISLIINMISMFVFIIAFYLRMKYTIQVQDFADEKSDSGVESHLAKRQKPKTRRAKR